MSKHIPFKTITTLKQDAKRLKKNEGLTQSEALERIANQEGFKSWGLLLRAIKENQIRSFEQLWETIMKPSVTIIAGRPAMGKTTLAVQLALKAAKSRDVLFFSLEMLATEITERALSVESEVETKKLRKKNYSESELRQVEAATKRLASLPLHVNDCYGICASEIKKQIQEKNYHNPFVVIDYLNLMQAEDKVEDRNEQIKSITTEIRAISRELRISILLLSQVTRAVDNRSDKRPLKTDLIGDVNFVDQLVFIYRNGHYNPNSDGKDAELIIPEHRNHQRYVLHCNYNSTINKFELN